MPLHNIDTFEHDIAEEIRTKEATVGDIASAGGDIGNLPTKPASTSLFYILLGIIFIVAILGVSGILIFKYYPRTPPAVHTETPAPGTPADAQIGAISETIRAAVAPSVGTVSRSDYGYTVELLSYSDVFAYMLKNENKYADEIAASVGTSRDASATGTPAFTFTDVTINNQNMRVGTSGSNTVVYAFVNAKYLLIAKTTDGILALRSAILR